jgi:hypothetical protein
VRFLRRSSSDSAVLQTHLFASTMTFRCHYLPSFFISAPTKPLKLRHFDRGRCSFYPEFCIGLRAQQLWLNRQTRDAICFTHVCGPTLVIHNAISCQVKLVSEYQALEPRHLHATSTQYCFTLPLDLSAVFTTNQPFPNPSHRPRIPLPFLYSFT